MRVHSLPDAPLELGATEIITVPIGDRTLELEQAAGIADLVHAAIASGNRHAAHWAVLWPSARALANYVAAAPDLSGKRIIELGCGIGAVGIAAAARGADVIVSDLEPSATQLAVRNAARNGLTVRGLAFDWNDPPPDLGMFDGIAAADVLYEDGMLRGVLRFVARHLAPEGIGLIADPMRVMPGGVSGAARLHRLMVEPQVVSAGPSFAGGVTVYMLRRYRPPT